VWLKLVVLAAAAALLAGCGDDDQPADEGALTEVTVTLDADGEGGSEPLVEKVSCPGGEAAVCAAVLDLPAAPVAPVPPQTACTEIFGGPDTFGIEGTLRGEQVDAEFTRANGCEIDRFDRFVPMLTELFPDYEPGGSLR
jgi:hypothetical protein